MIRIFFGLAAILLFTVMPASSATMVYDHDAHLERVGESSCKSCHGPNAISIKPERELCKECHDEDFLKGDISFDLTTHHGPAWSFNHGTYVRTEKYDCSICHEDDFCLECHATGSADEMGDFSNSMVNIHRSDFHITHPVAARTDQQLCGTCHENQFCKDCHEQFAPEDLAIQSHRRGWSDTAISGTKHSTFSASMCQTCHPDSVLPKHEWSTSHAREARKNLATCQACHPDGDTCLKCHSATSGLGVNPHPRDWADMAVRLKKAGDNRSCRKCH